MSETVNLEEFVNLNDIIRASLDALPNRCQDDTWHEWSIVYGHGNSLNPPKGIDFTKTIMFPYYLCKHCYAVSSNFTTTPPSEIKKVR